MHTPGDMSRVFSIRTPREIMFGARCHEQLGEVIGKFDVKAVVVVTDPGLVKAGVCDKIGELISALGIEYKVFDNIRPDPNIESVDDCLAVIKSIDAQLVVGLGGGSALDVAKCAAAVAGNGGNIADYVGIDKLPRRGLPTVLLPTTSGTGSEVSPVAILTDRKEENMKLGIVSPNIYCDIAMIDPTLTITCPPTVTAASGMDALTHAIEIYTNKFAVAFTDVLMCEAILLAMNNLRECVSNGSNETAREAMSLASFYAGMGLGPVNTAAVHALAYPLGGMFDVPHGLANSILLPYVLEFNRSACADKLAGLAKKLGICVNDNADKQASAFIEAVKKLSIDVGIPQNLCEIDVPQEQIPQMASAAMNVTRLLKNNPRKVSLDDAVKIYEAAHH